MKVFLVEVTDWNEDVPIWVDSVWTSPVKAEKRRKKILDQKYPDRRASVEMKRVEK